MIFVSCYVIQKYQTMYMLQSLESRTTTSFIPYTENIQQPNSQSRKCTTLLGM